MITTKIVLYHRKNKDGKNTLAIRITRDRRYSYVFVGQAIDEKDWNKKDCCVRKSHPNSGRLNKFLIKKLAEVNDASMEGEIKEGGQSAKDVHSAVVHYAGENNFFCGIRQVPAEPEDRGQV